MKEQRRARKIAAWVRLTGCAQCLLESWDTGVLIHPVPWRVVAWKRTLPDSCPMFSCWPHPVSCCFPVLPCPRRTHTGQNAGRRLFAWGLTLRWVDEQRGLSTAAALKWKSKAEGVWQRPQASAANDILRLPSLMLNKSFRIQGFKKKISED